MSVCLSLVGELWKTHTTVISIMTKYSEFGAPIEIHVTQVLVSLDVDSFPKRYFASFHVHICICISTRQSRSKKFCVSAFLAKSIWQLFSLSYVASSCSNKFLPREEKVLARAASSCRKGGEMLPPLVRNWLQAIKSCW